MQDRKLEALIRQVREADHLRAGAARPGADRSASLGRYGLQTAAAAAAVIAVILLWRPPTESAVPGLRTASTVRAGALAGVSLDYGPDEAGAAGQLRSCSEQDAYTMVVLRDWSDECGCVRWQVHTDPQGDAIRRLPAGEQVAIPLDFRGPATIAPVVLMAVAFRPNDLPQDVDAEAEMLACLNEYAGGEEASAHEQALATCLPSGVAVVRHAPFGRD